MGLPARAEPLHVMAAALTVMLIFMNARTARFHLSLVFIVALLPACSRNTPGEAAIREVAEAFVPQDATEKVLAPDTPWVQISFNVRRPWLEFAVDEKRINRAKLEGWDLCRPATAEWAGHEDVVVASASYRRLRTYVLYREGVLVQLLGMYDSPLESVGLEGEAEPAIQQGFVIAKKATEKDALRMAADFKLSCDMH